MIVSLFMFPFLLLCEAIYAALALTYSCNANMKRHMSQVTRMENGVMKTNVHWLQTRSKRIGSRQFGQVGFGIRLKMDSETLEFVHLCHTF